MTSMGSLHLLDREAASEIVRQAYVRFRGTRETRNKIVQNLIRKCLVLIPSTRFLHHFGAWVRAWKGGSKVRLETERPSCEDRFCIHKCMSVYVYIYIYTRSPWRPSRFL